ncbi:LysR family transcriptional regulator [Bosea thiooxidans]|uniref:DNA-binding transcriptional regulator, LysR family n=1 Tax=Bosea thiooxidans TaxID=53254 RepID=A0A0Q3IBU5_9HYPH|nr:LysR family transcriptional regulator [Bosea thiooxidans]KQK32352.1 LysR family transcriptional regulator [Bosea thiooxidans]SKC02966.1 DNA-binding transcriptional regulator, LysR family [Bosea thiooxidans]
MNQAAKPLAWDDFRLIKAIADKQALPAAAAALGVNHSTVFRRLGQIEAALGVRLFERHRSGYIATPAGEEMVQLAGRVDDDITAFARRLAGQEIEPAGELRVATNDSLLVDLLTPLFAQFLQQYPGIRLDVLIGNRAANLSKRDADVAIRATDNPPENLVGRKPARIAWALYGRAADFPDAASPEPSLLWERNWISLGEQFTMLSAVRYLARHVAPERVVYKLNTVLGLAEAVEAGIGIGFLPCFIGDTRPGLARLAGPNPDLAADLWLLTHPDMRHTPRVRLFLDFLAGEVARLRPLIEGERPIGRAPPPETPPEAGDDA